MLYRLVLPSWTSSSTRKGFASCLRHRRYERRRLALCTGCLEISGCKVSSRLTSQSQSTHGSHVADNWAMLFAQKLANKNKVALHVCFCLLPKFLEATIRHFKFMLDGM